MNSYWKHESGLVTKSDTPQMDKSLSYYGWVRINRDEYRRMLKSNKRTPIDAHDHRAMGESANEVSE